MYVCVTALHALDLQLANNALGPHSCLIITVHRDPLLHTCTYTHILRKSEGDLVTATQAETQKQTHADIHRDTHPFPQAPH